MYLMQVSFATVGAFAWRVQRKVASMFLLSKCIVSASARSANVACDMAEYFTISI